MSLNIPVEQRLLEKIRQLPSEKVIEVEDFIDFLYQRQTDSDHDLSFIATKLSEASFSKIWDNPEDAEYDNL
jgi:peptide subunit release factor 1 (eRF1)